LLLPDAASNDKLPAAAQKEKKRPRIQQQLPQHQQTKIKSFFSTDTNANSAAPPADLQQAAMAKDEWRSGGRLFKSGETWTVLDPQKR